MIVTVNGRPILDNFEHISNLEDVLVELSEGTLPEDHLVGSVIVNGKEFSELYPGQSQEVFTDTINKLEIATVSLDEFSEAALKDCQVFIERLMQSVYKTAALFSMSDESEATESFSQVLDTIRALVNFIGSLRTNLNWDFKTIPYKKYYVQNEWDRLVEIIDEIHNIQREADWILMADILEYEVTEILKSWKEIIALKSVDHKLDISHENPN